LHSFASVLCIQWDQYILLDKVLQQCFTFFVKGGGGQGG
jgi:hypothetical protein